ncbi:unnamed protein product [Bursaphelenchus okinawaensis]|uniref:Uncharacterized protein n=1 Tax=Bursaphelenchus okinawaensis TaxID=465554 RepID=A0A811JVM4_9BILA|nr:unnamed protein product [Bursaphelenchus okinawaensis]CAG9085996.1 unnamed protein product [Bursaphelenchus okinawaensis]
MTDSAVVVEVTAPDNPNSPKKQNEDTIWADFGLEDSIHELCLPRLRFPDMSILVNFPCVTLNFWHCLEEWLLLWCTSIWGINDKNGTEGMTLRIVC